MRKLICISALLLLFAGCAKQDMVKYDPVLDFYVLPGVYRPVSEGLTDEFSTKQDFAISGWSLEQGKNWERFSSEAYNWLELSRATANEVYLTDKFAEEQVKETLWTFTDDVKWPEKDLQLAFLAYSPFRSSSCDCSLEHGVSWRVDDITTQQTDLLYADVEMDRRVNVDGNVLNLCFDHALCRVDFRVKNRVDNNGDAETGVDPEKIVVESVSIDDIKYSGTFYSRADEQWTLRSDSKPLPIYSGEFQTSGRPEPIGTSWLMIPQVLDTEVTVKFSYVNFAGNTIRQELQTDSPLKTTLLPGHHYVYTLSVGIDDVQFFQEEIEKGM